jgi:hypothetical protein
MNAAIGPAFARVLAALDGRTVVGSGTKRMASCPGPGHWRGDIHPSLSVEAKPGKALVHCQAGCHVEDVLGAVGLTLADLFDDPSEAKPKRRISRGKAEDAVAEAGLPMIETLTMMMLLRRAHNDTLEVPDWRTPSLPQLAREVRCDVRRLKRVRAHLDQHRWLKYVPGQGRGHKSVYLLLPEGEPGDSCNCIKEGSRDPLLQPEKRGHLEPIKGGIGRDISPAQSTDVTKGYVARESPAPGEQDRQDCCAVCGSPVSLLGQAQTRLRFGRVLCSAHRPGDEARAVDLVAAELGGQVIAVEEE